MKYIFILILLSGCSIDPSTNTTTKSTTGSTQKCNTGECYSYLENFCCPRSAPYACNGYCYTYSGGGSCTNYKTQCY